MPPPPYLSKPILFQCFLEKQAPPYFSETRIDIVIVRDGNVVNVSELKFRGKPFAIDKKYEMELREKVVCVEELKTEIKRPSHIHHVFSCVR